MAGLSRSRTSSCLLLLALLVAGCGTSRPARPVAVRPSHAPFARPPTIDGSRLACLAPPYTPAVGATTLADGTPVRRESDGRHWVVSLFGEQEPTPEEGEALVGRLRAHEGLFAWVSYGLYCGTSVPAGLCLRYEGNLCETHVDDVARDLRAAIAADPVLPHPRIKLVIELTGRTGPRCGADDPACLPQPYDHGAHFDPEGSRHGGVLPQYSYGACQHDGDCVTAGCGNHCIAWEYGGAHEGGTCEGYVFARPAFCGCVSGQCEWFSQ